MASGGQADDWRKDRGEDDGKQKRPQRHTEQNMLDTPEREEDSGERDPEADASDASEESSQESRAGSAQPLRPLQQQAPATARPGTGHRMSGQSEDNLTTSHKLLHLPRVPRQPCRRYLSSSPLRRTDSNITLRPASRDSESLRRTREMPRWWEDSPQGGFPLLDIHRARARRRTEETSEADLTTPQVIRSGGRNYRSVPMDQTGYLRAVIDSLPSRPGPGPGPAPKFSLIPSVSLQRASPLPDTKLQYPPRPRGQGPRQAAGAGEEEELGAEGGGERSLQVDVRRRKERCFSGPHEFCSLAPVDFREGRRGAGAGAGAGVDRHQTSSTGGAEEDSGTSDTEDSGDPFHDL